MLYPIESVRIFANNLDHPEGIAVGPEGTMYAGGEAGQVYRISSDGKRVQTIAQTGGFCLGITPDRSGNLFVCDEGKHALFKVTNDGQVSVFADASKKEKFTCPNFCVFDSMGRLYLTDSGTWKGNNGVIYRLSAAGEVTLFAPGPFSFPNGLAIDSSEGALYVVETNRDRVLRIEIRDDASAGSIDVFAEGLARCPDGVALDSNGNLYVTTYASNCIYRVSPQGAIHVLCQDVENVLLSQPTNCAFGGSNFDQLLVANLGAHHIAVLDLGVKGQLLWHQR